MTKENKGLPEEMQKVASQLTLDPRNIDEIASLAGMAVSDAMIILSKLEMEGIAREIWPGSFVRGDIG